MPSETLICSTCSYGTTFDPANPESVSRVSDWVFLNYSLPDEGPMPEAYFRAVRDPGRGVEILCPDCVAERAWTCNYCSETSYRMNDGRTIDHEIVCEECLLEHFFFCEVCNEYRPSSEVYYDYLGAAACSDCLAYYETCVDCNEYVHAEDAHEHETLDGELFYRCPRCEDYGDEVPNLPYPETQRLRRMRDRAIRNYTYRPDDLKVRIGTSKTKLKEMNLHNVAWRMAEKRTHVFGMELEVEPKEATGATFQESTEIAEWISTTYADTIYLKEDSSLGAYGFEIVTHPASLDWWHSEGTRIFGEILGRLRRSGFQSHNGGRCGLHIHTNLAAVSRMQLHKMMLFMYNPDNHDRIVKLSRRSEGQLTDYARLRLGRIYDHDTGTYINPAPEKYALTVAMSKRTAERNVALNARGQTAELRLFRGTLRDDRLWTSLQFYALLLQYCSIGEPGSPKWEDFRRYVFNSGKHFNALRSYFQEVSL